MIKHFFTIIILLNLICINKIYSQESLPLECDKIKLKTGDTLEGQIQEINKKEIVYFLCCKECLVPRHIKMKDIDTLIKSERTEILLKEKALQEMKQDSLKNLFILNKNTFQIDLGFNPLIYGEINASYERFFHTNDKNLHSAFGYQIGFGKYAVWGIGGNALQTNLVYLSGRKDAHLELTGGINMFLNGDLYGYLPLMLSTSIGYRYQKINKTVFPTFRVGLAWPEGLYLGLGLSF